MPTRPYLSGEPGVRILHLLAGHEVQFAADPEQNEFHRILKVGVDGRGEAMVSIGMDLAPHDRRAVSESPPIQQSKALWEESVRRPEKQCAVILCWHLHRLDLSELHVSVGKGHPYDFRLVALFITPRRIDDNGAELRSTVQGLIDGRKFSDCFRIRGADR